MIGGVGMCDFCKNIYKSDYENQDYKDYIYKSEYGIFIHFTTGDSFMDFCYKINFTYQNNKFRNCDKLKK